MRNWWNAVLFVLVVTAALHGAPRDQSPAPAGGPAAFDVASVKPYQPGERRGSSAIGVMPGGRFTAPAATLRELIGAAYGILDIQIVDPDGLLPNDRFAIEATTRADVTAADARAMLRGLLAERFRLAVHTETRELPVYLLVPAHEDRRLGEQLRRSGPDCAPVTPPPGIPMPPPPPGAPPGPPPSGRVTGPGLMLNAEPLRCVTLNAIWADGGHWSLREMTMGRVAERLIDAVGRPVIDRTGLEGPFDLDLTYAAEAAAVPPGVGTDAPSLFTALQEQLGLRLESARAPVDVLVIDRVAPPTEN